MRVLVIEDEPNIAEALKHRLSQRYAVDIASTGRRGIYLTQISPYDIILLDLCLPDLDGLDVCRIIRQQKLASHILVLTGEDDLTNKISLLDAGADDYVTKPFSYAELSARIRALLRRNPDASANNIVTIDDMIIDLKQRTVYRSNRLINLRRKEFDILEFMIRYRGKVLNRETIHGHVWANGSSAISNCVTVHIRSLRERIDKPFKKRLIRTVYGVGYAIGEAVQE